MRRPVAGGGSERAHLEVAAKRGSATAIAQLAGPPLPDALAGLWAQFLQLDGMRRFGMTGPERLTPSDIDAANRLYEWGLRPHEAQALALLDLVTLFPDAAEER